MRFNGARSDLSNSQGDLMRHFLSFFIFALVTTLAFEAAAQEPGFVGVEIRHLTKPEADKLGWEAPRGAGWVRPAEDGPAFTAGILPGDIIASMDGVEVPNGETFTRTVSEKEPGTQV